MLSTYYNKTASDAKFNLKVNITDTASMLSGYYRTTNPSGYITASAIANKVNYSDTASMLSTYYNKTATDAKFALAVKYTDTATMLSAYYNKTATDAKVNLKVNISDTASMLSGYKTYYPRAAISLTVTGSSGASSYSNSTGVLNVPTYTLSGLGGEPAITAGTTSQYWRGDKTWQTLNTTAVAEGTNLYYTDARARAALSFTAGSGAYNNSTGVITIPTNTNQLTNGAGFISSYTETDPVVKAINGIVKSNGTTISAASAGTDYVSPSGLTTALSSYLPLAGGILTGSTSLQANNKFWIQSNLSTYGQFQIGNNTANGESSMVFIGGNASGMGTITPSSSDGTSALWGIGSGLYGLGTNYFIIGNGAYGAPIFKLKSTGEATFVNSISSSSFIKSGGTSSQFLKADGSVDNSTYLSTGSASATYVPYAGAVGSVNLNTYSFTANKMYGNYTTNLRNYNTVNPSTNVSLMSSPNTVDSWIFLDQADASSNWGIYHRQIDSALGTLEANSIAFVGGGNSSLKAFVGLNTGNGYFSGGVTATSFSGSGSGLTGTASELSIGGNAATVTNGLTTTNYSSYALPLSGGILTGTETINTDNGYLILNRSATNKYIGIDYKTSNSEKWFAGLRETGTDNYIIYNANTTSDVFTLNVTNNAATFSSSVTAGGLITTQYANALINIRGTSGSNSYLKFTENGVADRWSIGSDAGSGTLNFRQGGTGGTQSMVITTSGNVGIGVTPSAWNSGSTALQIIRGGLWHDGSGYFAMTNNSYYDGTNWRYIATTFASIYNQVNSTHVWSIAPSGTAGNAISFTQAMTLNPSGNLLIGTTTDNGYKLNVNGNGYFSSNVKIVPTSESWGEGLSFYMPTTGQWGGLRWQRNRSGSDGNWAIGYTALDYTDDLVFSGNNSGTQVDNIIRLKKSGNVLIGTTTDLGYKFQVAGDIYASGNMVINGGTTWGGVNTQAYGYGHIYKGYTGSAYDVMFINPGNAVDELQVIGGLNLTTTTAGFTVPNMTTTQKNALTKRKGMIVYDTTINLMQAWNGASWNNLW